MVKKYNVLYADCPWSYSNKKTGRTNGDQPEGSGAETQYLTLSTQEIIDLPVRDIMEKNCILFLWATVPLMPDAFKVMEGWGFTYKTMITWRKIMSLGMGYWFRGQCEHLLMSTKGNVKAFRQQKANFYKSTLEGTFQIDELYQSKAGKHSQKPHYFRELISTAVKVSFEEPKKLEMFARSRDGMFSDYEYEGWDVYGNQVNNSIVL